MHHSNWAIMRVRKGLEELENTIKESLKMKIPNKRPRLEHNLISVATQMEHLPNSDIDLSDYIKRNQARKAIEAATKEDMKERITSLCSILHDNTRIWQKINIGSLRTDTMLMLSGLAQDQNGQIASGEIISHNERWGCTKECLSRSNQKQFNQHITTHRAINCEKEENSINRKELHRIINRAHSKDQREEINEITTKMIKHTMEHDLYRLRILTKFAFNK